MTELHPDPIGDAGHRAAQLAQIVIMAAEAAVVIGAARTRAAAEGNEQAARAVSTELAATHKAASDLWSPVLADHQRGQLDVAQTLAAWSAAQAWRSTDASAARASDAAEERLHELRPSAMMRYDDLRQRGVDPVGAMRQVVPLLESDARMGHMGSQRIALIAEAETTATPVSPWNEEDLDLLGREWPDQVGGEPKVRGGRPGGERREVNYLSIEGQAPHRTARLRRDVGQALSASFPVIQGTVAPVEGTGTHRTGIRLSRAATRGSVGGSHLS